MALTQSDRISPEQYLAEEAVSEERHEYFDGLVYAMTGGTLKHNILSMNLLEPQPMIMRCSFEH